MSTKARKRSKSRRRPLRAEKLEERRLLAVILFEDFETTGSNRTGVPFTRSAPDSVGNIDFASYFGITELSPELTGFDGSAANAPTTISYENIQGNDFYSAQNIDDAIPPAPTEFGDPTIRLEWTAIDVSQFSNLNLSWYAAEDDRRNVEHWDGDDSVTLRVRRDGGTLETLFEVEGDADGKPIDGVTGAEITDVFTQFSSALADANLLDIEWTIRGLNEEQEDIALDSLLLTGTERNAPPLVTSITRASEHTNLDTLRFLVRFSEEVVNVSAEDFSVHGTTATVTEITPSPFLDNGYNVTISGGDLADLDGIVGLDIAAGQDIEDVAGAPLPDGEPPIDETYIVDNTAPTLLSIERQDPTTLTNADVLRFSVTFSEPLRLTTNSEFFTASGTTGQVVFSSPFTLQETHESRVEGGDLPDFDGLVGLDLGPNTANITDQAGNSLIHVEPPIDETYQLDNTPPTLREFATVGVSETSEDSLRFRLRFSEPVLLVSDNDFEVTGTTASVSNIDNVFSNNDFYHIDVAGGDLPDLNATVGLDLA